ncbi:hypothetical protein LY90DRAFT_628471 [Neocallimastix californiae]|uniref:Uncharacterized protein n=1 Tax=Neocallimastix californiae TaxID=1754190 RepID=A0A1Y2AZD5_9FUNG|nr:hypothetical protein LY90DRAFT_628471 [Neocallimastix californiae]|eukprot:ORY27834.1 hypothetical protein LY90DRAFT_628471 [Neocallimastix californiae]
MKFQFILLVITSFVFATASVEVSDAKEGVITPVESNANTVSVNNTSINSEPELNTVNVNTTKDNVSTSVDKVPDDLTVTDEGNNGNSVSSGDNLNASAFNNTSNVSEVSNNYSEGKTDEAEVNKVEDTASNANANEIPIDTGDVGKVSDGYEEGKNKIKENDIKTKNDNGISVNSKGSKGDTNDRENDDDIRVNSKDSKGDTDALDEDDANAVEESGENNSNSSDTTIAAGLAGAAAISSAGLFIWVKRSKRFLRS